ncbi:phospho-sugar mutase, partial [Kitasatospora sp. NPDC059463]
MTQATTTDLLARARTWLAEDPDPQTREELAALLAAAEDPEAESRGARPRGPRARALAGAPPAGHTARRRGPRPRGR